jgi:predicted ATPase/DNA-binding SARP family transcriptional activator/DNA-binding NarL/FixJ family response regulator
MKGAHREIVERSRLERRGAQVGEVEAVRVWMLGGFSVSVGARTIEEDGGWRLRKAASLVKLLALEDGHRLHRERVMDLLWPDLDKEAARNNLRFALHVARRTLEPAPATTSSHYLRLVGEQLALCTNVPLWVDVEAFLEAAATARHTREPTAYRAAVELYSGDLLPGDLYETWAEDRRAELRRTYVALLVEFAGLYEKREELGPAVEALGKAVAAEPTHEEAHTGLMRLYALSGRRRKAIKQYEQLVEALSGEVDLDPGAEVKSFYDDIVAGRLPPPRSAGKNTLLKDSADAGYTLGHNLPAPRTSFVGRERELVDVKRLLAMTRLLTLTGTGGSGKTRLALAVAKDLVGAYPDGVWFVELAPLSEETLVPQAVADALSVREQPEHPLDATLVEALRAKKMLLLLDNCEHLIDAAARLVETLLDSCPELRILATSRETLGVMGEANWRVPSLSLPDPQRSPTIDELAGYESARLFLDRALYRSSAFVLSSENVGAVAEICNRLDGIPLAIELAAARVGTLAVEQISARLGDSLKLLTGGSRTATPRQQTLRGTLDWGYELLSEPEKRVFCSISVFTGGWTLEAAEVVGAGSGIEEGDVLDLVSRLVDKSLVVAEVSAGGILRYRMLEPVRQYGRERLEQSGEMEAARRRHALWYLALAEEAETKLIGAEQTGWLERLETEHDNLRAALGWFLERGEAELGLRLGGALGEFWRLRGHLREGLRWLQTLLYEGGDASPGRVRALVHAGWMAWERADFERSTRFSEEALALSRKLGDKEGAATALHNLGMVTIYDQMRAEEAQALFEESLALRRELGDKAGASRTLQRMGLISVVQHDFERAAALYEETLALGREAGDKVAVSIALWLGGLAFLGLGDHDKVGKLCEKGLDLARQLGHTHVVALILHVLAASAGQQGRAVRSARLWGASESLLDVLGVALGPAERYHYDPYIAAARALLDEAAWKAARAEGRAMTLEEAVEYALLEEEPASPTASALERIPADEPPAKLTRRERKVATLVAQGLTNRRIAEELHIAERTAANHVANILKKLGLRSRDEVAARLEERRL